jgi:hypothetical protein
MEERLGLEPEQLKLTSESWSRAAFHTYDRPGRSTVAGEAIDILGNDTMKLVLVSAE